MRSTLERKLTEKHEQKIEGHRHKREEDKTVKKTIYEIEGREKYMQPANRKIEKKKAIEVYTLYAGK